MSLPKTNHLPLKEIVKMVLSGDVRTVASLIRKIDDGMSEAFDILKCLYPHTGRAMVVGLTGPPGVGKSTLTDSLISHLRDLGKTVGVLAVDPTSPFSGGAILGDRIRMRRHMEDDGVFIRSIATRGEFGGITTSTRGAINVLDAMGKDVILVETVGVGQDEVDIARVANTTLVITAPGLGDKIQAIKAGILEVGDIFIVNKADKDGAEQTVQELKAMTMTGKMEINGDRDWIPPVEKTIAIDQKGIKEVWADIEAHQAYIDKNTRAYHRRMLFNHKLELIDMVKHRLLNSILEKMDRSGELDQYLEDIVSHKTDPFTICEKIFKEYSKLLDGKNEKE